MKRIVLLLFIVILTCFTQFVEGFCIHNGHKYRNLTVWRMDPCTMCKCDSPNPVCESVRCRATRLCNISKGDYLHIPADQCCPVCRRNPKPCRSPHSPSQYIQHNEEWSEKSCQRCVCYDGRVSCRGNTCPTVRCNPGTVTQQLSGKCCPQCVPIGQSCNHESVVYSDGRIWNPAPCVQCLCRNGRVSCYTQQCPKSMCKKEDVVAPTRGECCPKCLKHGCQRGDDQYLEGESWKLNPCTICSCHYGQISCSYKSCSMLNCKQNEKAVKIEGECCPKCVPNEGVCIHRAKVYYSEAVWNVSHCDYCQCLDGNVSCHRAECDKLNCAKVPRKI
ncbi:extracellular matrix organizing protein FRAS1-like [Tubulanus polymorphus]|uniref:extracellular matrix organizing protein FRAS1-like n=1 Tax=Tubulanus polymorphus TaxID=672921 RepID=UPI003DA24F30